MPASHPARWLRVLPAATLALASLLVTAGTPPTTPVASEYCVMRPRYMSAKPLPVVSAPVPLNVYVP